MKSWVESFLQKDMDKIWWQERKDLELSLDITNENTWDHQGGALEGDGRLLPTATISICKP